MQKVDSHFSFDSNDLGGSLSTLIKEHKKKGSENLLKEEEILKIFAQICEGVRYLHEERKMIHRELKPDKLLISSNGTIKIGDFGLSKVFEVGKQYALSQVGTISYMSPEIYDNGKYDYKSDIWALGVILYELCALKRPFENNSSPLALMKLIVEKEPLPIPDVYSTQLKDLLQSLLLTPSLLDKKIFEKALTSLVNSDPSNLFILLSHS